jgi:hypothetical protein
LPIQLAEWPNIGVGSSDPAPSALSISKFHGRIHTVPDRPAETSVIERHAGSRGSGSRSEQWKCQRVVIGERLPFLAKFFSEQLNAFHTSTEERRHRHARPSLKWKTIANHGHSFSNLRVAGAHDLKMQPLVRRL